MAPLPPQFNENRAELPGTTHVKTGLSVMSSNGRQGSVVGLLPTSVLSYSQPRQLFDRYDNDGSGSISISEFRNLCYDMGYFLTDQELLLDLKLLDVDGNGTLSYAEFIKWWKQDDRFRRLQLTEPEIAELNKYLAHFKKFDKDCSGILDIREFKGLYADLVKRKMAISSLMATLQELDVNKDGKISFNEYVNWAISRCNGKLSSSRASSQRMSKDAGHVSDTLTSRSTLLRRPTSSSSDGSIAQ
ncbi:hypothetical protein BC830DRAFT_842122 [Chytriomyces sp. MP71]|nr:hypothetical protein BC830DRAFT_842122 [Chytriomyces sp. MP71]